MASRPPANPTAAMGCEAQGGHGAFRHGATTKYLKSCKSETMLKFNQDPVRKKTGFSSIGRENRSVSLTDTCF